MNYDECTKITEQIEALKQENKKLREALDQAVHCIKMVVRDGIYCSDAEVVDTARAVLNEIKGF